MLPGKRGGEIEDEVDEVPKSTAMPRNVTCDMYVHHVKEMKLLVVFGLMNTPSLTQECLPKQYNGKSHGPTLATPLSPHAPYCTSNNPFKCLAISCHSSLSTSSR